MIVIIIAAVVVLLVVIALYLAFNGIAPASVLACIQRLKRAVRGGSAVTFSSTLIEEHILLGSMPQTEEDFAQLREKGVTALVAAVEASELPASFGDCAQGMACHVMGIPAFTPPRKKAIQATLEWITAQIQAGGTVCVFCTEGKDRSAVVVVCYLMLLHNLAEFAGGGCLKAYHLVTSKRRIHKLPAMCQMLAMWRAVRSYERLLVHQWEAGDHITTKHEGVGMCTAAGGEMGPPGMGGQLCSLSDAEREELTRMRVLLAAQPDNTVEEPVDADANDTGPQAPPGRAESFAAEDEARVAKIQLFREVLDTCFQRYDVDGSGTLNTQEELHMLVTNLLFKLEILLGSREMTDLISSAGDMAELRWTQSQFAEWFEASGAFG